MQNLHESSAGRRPANNGRQSNGGTGLATAGLVCAIIAAALSFIPIINNASYVLGTLAVIFGIVGLVKKMGGKAVAALIIGVIALAGTWYFQSETLKSLNKASDDFNKSMEQTNKDMKDMSGDNTDELLGKTVEVNIGQFSATTDQYGIVTTELPVNIKNLLGEKKSYTVQIEAVDANGNRLADDTVYANDLGGNQAQDFKAFIYVESGKLEAVKSATFKIVKVSAM